MIRTILKFVIAVGMCVSAVVWWFLYIEVMKIEVKKPEPYYVEVERRYTHCYPVMKFKNKYKNMYFEDKCETRTYITEEEVEAW